MSCVSPAGDPDGSRLVNSSLHSNGERSRSGEQGRPPKILMFIEATSVNGAAKSLLNFCDTIASAGRKGEPPISISIATFQRGLLNGNESPNGFVEAVRQRAIPAHVIPERHRFDSRLLKSIQAVVRKAAPDIVQTNNVKSHFLVRAAGIRKHSHWIAFHHGYTATDLKMKCYNQLDRWSLRSAERVVTVCGAFGRQLVASGVARQRVRVVHNSGELMPCPSPAELSNLKRRLGIEEEATVLLAIGRLSHEKGHADLIHAANWLRQLRPGLKYKLVLVGFGPEQTKLEALTGRLGLRSQIVFATKEPDVAPFYGIADAFVLPSHSEGSPHVIFEAMAAGVPIVATSVGGIPELLEDNKTAVLAMPKNPKNLALGIARMLDSREAARGYAEKATQVLRQQFSPEVYAGSLLKIYSEILKGSVPETLSIQ